MENNNVKKIRGELPEVFREIKNSELAEADKVAKAYEWMIDRILEHSQRDIELARAMKDQEAIIREQIKHAVMKSAKGMFQDCFRAVLGRKTRDA